LFRPTFISNLLGTLFCNKIYREKYNNPIYIESDLMNNEHIYIQAFSIVISDIHIYACNLLNMEQPKNNNSQHISNAYTHIYITGKYIYKFLCIKRRKNVCNHTGPAI